MEGRRTVICSSSIEEFDNILVFVDQGGKLGGVFTLRDELIDSLIRLLAMAMMTLATLAAFTTMMLLVILRERCNIYSQFLNPVGGRV